MKFIILMCVCFLSLEYSQGAEEINLSGLFQGALDINQRELPQGATNERCDKLSDFVTRAMAEVKKTFPPERRAYAFKMESAMLGFDVTSESARRPILCKIADAKNLHELFEAIPKGITRGNYNAFVNGYNTAQKQVITIGGYTNVERLVRTFQDTHKWRDQLKPGQNLKEMMDLATLIDFFNVMQVKYGSRWLSAPILVEDQNFLIEDPEDFAKKLYECKTYKDVMAALSLDEEKATGLLDFLIGHRVHLPPEGFMDIYIEGANLLGDMGFLNLKP